MLFYPNKNNLKIGRAEEKIKEILQNRPPKLTPLSHFHFKQNIGLKHWLFRYDIKHKVDIFSPIKVGWFKT